MLKGTALATHNFRHFFNVLSTPLTLPPRFYSQCIITRQINPDYLILFEAKSQDFFPQLTWSTIVTSAFVIFNLHALELSFYRDYFTWPQHTHRARSSLGEVLVCGRSWRDTSWQTSAIIDKLSKRIQSPIQYEIASRFSITSLYPRLYPRLYPHPSQLDLPFPAFPGIPLTSANQNHMYPVKKTATVIPSNNLHDHLPLVADSSDGSILNKSSTIYQGGNAWRMPCIACSNKRWGFVWELMVGPRNEMAVVNLAVPVLQAYLFTSFKKDSLKPGNCPNHRTTLCLIYLEPKKPNENRVDKGKVESRQQV